MGAEKCEGEPRKNLGRGVAVGEPRKKRNQGEKW